MHIMRSHSYATLRTCILSLEICAVICRVEEVLLPAVQILSGVGDGLDVTSTGVIDIS